MQLKGDIDLTGYESKTKKQNRKVELLHQAMIVSKWAESFNASNINDFFDKDSNPSKLGGETVFKQIQGKFIDTMNEMELTQLSPNHPALNT